MKASAFLEQAHEGTVIGIDFSPDGKLLATCSRTYRNGRGHILVWLVEDSRQAGTVIEPTSVTDDGLRVSEIDYRRK